MKSISRLSLPVHYLVCGLYSTSHSLFPASARCCCENIRCHISYHFNSLAESFLPGLRNDFVNISLICLLSSFNASMVFQSLTAKRIRFPSMHMTQEYIYHGRC